MIDVRRSVCQHCGHTFELAPGTERHPDEIAKGIVAPASTNSGKSDPDPTS
jgi:hypothetical protein